MAGAITHKEVVIPPPGPLIDGVDWLAEHQLNAPEIGAVLVGDPSQSDKANWVLPGAPGQVLVTNGPGVLPSFQTVVLTLHNVLSATHGDAVVAAPVRGDLFFANATPKWDRLPIGAAGAFLVSNGTDPSWSTTLTVADLSVTTLTVAALTAGRVVFAGTAGLLDDDTNFAWDDTGKNLRIGAVTPGTSLAKGIVWGSGAAPTAAHPADAAQLWVGDNIAAAAGTAGLWIRNEAGGRVYIGDSGFAESQIRIFDSTLAKSVKLVVSASSAIFGSDEDIPFIFGTAGTERIQMLTGGNIIIGVDTAVGTSAQRVLYLDQGVAPTTSPADKAALWTADISGVAGATGLHTRSETGHVSSFGRLHSIPAGDGTAKALSSGALSVQTVNVGNNADTAEKIGATYTLPASTLSVNTHAVYVRTHFTCAANGNTKTGRIRFGGIGGTIVSTIAGPQSGNGFFVDALIIRTGAATQDAWGYATRDGGPVSVTTFSQPTQTLANNIDIVATVQSGTASANDCVCRGLYVAYIPGA